MNSESGDEESFLLGHSRTPPEHSKSLGITVGLTSDLLRTLGTFPCFVSLCPRAEETS